MSCLTNNPYLGHITTFGGHPVSCAAAIANIGVIQKEKLVEQVEEKSKLFQKLLKHKSIKSFRGKGLLIALEFADKKTNIQIIQKCIEKGVILDWFLFAPHCMRIAPPLIITEEEIKTACEIIISNL